MKTMLCTRNLALFVTALLLTLIQLAAASIGSKSSSAERTIRLCHSSCVGQRQCLYVANTNEGEWPYPNTNLNVPEPEQCLYIANTNEGEWPYPNTKLNVPQVPKQMSLAFATVPQLQLRGFKMHEDKAATIGAQEW